MKKGQVTLRKTADSKRIVLIFKASEASNGQVKFHKKVYNTYIYGYMYAYLLYLPSIFFKSYPQTYPQAFNHYYSTTYKIFSSVTPAFEPIKLSTGINHYVL